MRNRFRIFGLLLLTVSAQSAAQTESGIWDVPRTGGDTTKAVGINIHMAGKRNLTGKYTKNNEIIYVSKGCILIDYNQWSNFVNIFNNSSQKNNIVGIIVLR